MFPNVIILCGYMSCMCLLTRKKIVVIKGKQIELKIIMKYEKQSQSQFNQSNLNEVVTDNSKLQLIQKNETEKLLLYDKTTKNDMIKLVKLKQNKQTQSFHDNGTQTERNSSIQLNEQFDGKQLTQEQEDAGKAISNLRRHKSLNRQKKSLSIFQNNIIYGALVAPQCNINSIVEFKLPQLSPQMSNKQHQKIIEVQQQNNKMKKNQIQRTLSQVKQNQLAQFSQLILPPIQTPEQITNFKSKLFSDIKKERFQKFNCDLKERIFKIQDNYINKIQFNQFVDELF
ncbi:hypothetical protein TTHERM_00299730 (macronuclear) [Tetrahymena thermophila SB210]|uniref:Uncharacterized protein n=1 Tax=Tetrahymena thermophila (strain SB210) TaxID=312017 RepID=I7MM65_TETTS|nr:hypothetical protein TTHERM_00299730 [Tetrahymena thermophila SB210]EAS04255.2 hypothetical protein TTHERM_00299730 [Tetrahymena thermophila SB210]|eukprot:XP_001024500.2 hypothetical protein TTHERM_00299730 [Tetrahymena thermophila SB210]